MSSVNEILYYEISTIDDVVITPLLVAIYTLRVAGSVAVLIGTKILLKRIQNNYLKEWLGAEKGWKHLVLKPIKIFSWFIAISIALTIMGVSVTDLIQEANNAFHTFGIEITPFNLLLVLVILFGTSIALKSVKLYLINKWDEEHKGRSQSFYLLIKYFAWVLAICFSIQTIGINVSIIIAGSASLLVGIGFGMQGIFNDIISGIFMLFEGVIKVGDIINVDDQIGKVKEINLRTTTIVTRDDTDLIIPNHKFVNENVQNWSYSGFNTRFKVTVGVAYGTDAEMVREILLSVANDNKSVSLSPAPNVQFSDFGDSALIFKLLFWSDEVYGIDAIKSELRFEINKRFKEAEIQIPFPQRDVHIFNH